MSTSLQISNMEHTLQELLQQFCIRFDLILIFAFLDIYFLKKKKSAFSSYLYTSVSLKTPYPQNTKKTHNNIKN